jgi:hypothetical protein
LFYSDFKNVFLKRNIYKAFLFKYLMEKSKKIKVMFLLFLFLSGSFGFLLVGAETLSEGGSEDIFNTVKNWVRPRWELWKLGASEAEPEKMGMLAETLKYLVLILVSLAVYGAFSAMEFPSSAPLRLILSFIVGLLGTFMITTKELLTILVSYSALTTTVLIAVPLIAILGFTVMAAYKANAAGLYAAKILWAVFALFLIFKGLVLILLMQHFVVSGAGTSESPYIATSVTGKLPPSYVLPFVPMKSFKIETIGEGESARRVRRYETDSARLGRMLGNADLSTAWILLLVGGVIFIIMVWNGKWIAEWLKKEARDSQIQAAKSNIELSTARDKIQADAMKDVAKT